MQYIIDDYKKLLAHIDILIKASGYKIDFLSKKLNISRESFYQKRKKLNFTVNEMEELIKYIDNEEVETALFGKIMDSTERGNLLNEKETREIFYS